MKRFDRHKMYYYDNYNKASNRSFISVIKLMEIFGL